MAVVFGKTAPTKAKANVLAPVFAADIGVYDETEGDSGSANGALRIVTNYRGFTKDKAGRKAALMHQTVLDLSALGQCIPLGELDSVIEALSKVRDEIAEAGVLAGKGNPLLNG